MKKIITLILCMSVAIVLGIFSTIALAANNTTSEDNIPSETSTDVELSAIGTYSPRPDDLTYAGFSFFFARR